MTVLNNLDQSQQKVKETLFQNHQISSLAIHQECQKAKENIIQNNQFGKVMDDTNALL